MWFSVLEAMTPCLDAHGQWVPKFSQSDRHMPTFSITCALCPGWRLLLFTYIFSSFIFSFRKRLWRTAHLKSCPVNLQFLGRSYSASAVISLQVFVFIHFDLKVCRKLTFFWDGLGCIEWYSLIWTSIQLFTHCGETWEESSLIGMNLEIVSRFRVNQMCFCKIILQPWNFSDDATYLTRWLCKLSDMIYLLIHFFT